MKKLIYGAALASLVAVAAVVADASPKRFKIKNRINGQEFMIESEDGRLGEMQPEWGKPKGERECAALESGEEDLVLSRRTVRGRQLCTVDDHFEIVEIDIKSERDQKKAERDAKKAEREAIEDLKDKTSLTDEERDRILLYWIKHKMD